MEALLDLARVVDVEYGCLFAGDDEERALSESVLGVTYDWAKGRPDWASEIDRMQSARPRFGQIIRGVYWGNFLGEGLASAVGGEAALSTLPIAAKVPLERGVWFLQATPTVGEYDSPEGILAMAALRRAFAPVLLDGSGGPR